MSDSAREEMFLQMVREFPDSPMGHFSLGKYYLGEANDSARAAACFTEAVKLDPTYAAALVALGDAWAAQGDAEQARSAWNQAMQTPHGRKDLSLQADLEQRLSELQ